MSFNFTFSAKTVGEAKSKLREQFAPAIVKALVETALDAILVPQGGSGSPATGSVVSNVASGSPRIKPVDEFLGVYVQVWGHISEVGSRGQSEIQRFIVMPLYG